MNGDDELDAGGVGLGRTLALSDGIFAISMTLLAFQIKSPGLTPKHPDLTSALAAMSGTYYVYGLSFAVIGLLWLAHHRLFGHVERADEVLMFVNLAFLMVVAAIPFPSSVLGQYGGHTSAVVLYAAVMALAGALLTALTLVVQRRHLLSPSASGVAAARGVWRGATMTAVFLVSIPLAFVNPDKAPLVWLFTILARFVPSDARRRARAAKRAARPA